MAEKINTKRKKRLRVLYSIFLIVLFSIVIGEVIFAFHVKGVVNDFNEKVKYGIDNPDIDTPSSEDVKELGKRGAKKAYDLFQDVSDWISKHINKSMQETKDLLDGQIKDTYNTKPIGEIADCNLEKVSYSYSIDGDTIVVSKDDGNLITVRLIGINTPESVAHEEYLEEKGTQNSEYGKLASEYTINTLYNYPTVYLQYDSEIIDQYGRTLAYVWLNPDVDTTKREDIEAYMLNACILKSGYAQDVVYEPNHTYATLFSELRTQAEQNGIGLWQYPDINNYY